MASELDSLTANLQNYIVAPLNAFGLGGFVFDIPGEATTKLEADITDHYTEDNKATQDHIARKPKIITLRGYVGELVYKDDGQSSVMDAVQSVTQKLTELSAFLPTISTAASQIQDVVSNQTIGFNEGISSAADIYGMVKNVIGSAGDMANQQKAFRYFQACWQQGILMGIQTPWEFLTNMAIQSVTAIQSEGSDEISDFAVTYKQMRFAKTTSGAYSPAKSAGSAPQGADDLSPLANQDALNAYRSANGMDTPTIDKVLLGAAATQAANPVAIGSVSGASLPSSLLSGAQSYVSQASDLMSNSSVAKIFEHAVGQ